MSVPLRLLLVLLLSLAMPVQGYAAAAMRFCGPVHERMAGAHHGPTVHSQAHGEHAAGHAHDVEHVMAEAGGSAQDWQHLAGFDCSACAACCSAAMLPFEGLKLPAAPPGAQILLQPRPRVAAFLTGGPERPPR